jgi:hypothetical protein
VNLVRHFALAVIAKEVLLQQFRQLQRLLVLLPATLGLSHELRLEFLEGLWLSDDLLLEPLDG